MKPEINEEWEQALSCLEKAEKLYEVGKFQEAAREADGAITFGIHTIHALAEELKLPDLSVIQENAFYEWIERKEKHYTPKETVEWVRKTLKRLSDELPPDTLKTLK